LDKAAALLDHLARGRIGGLGVGTDKPKKPMGILGDHSLAEGLGDGTMEVDRKASALFNLLLYHNPFFTHGLLVALMMEAVSTSETSFNANQTTRCNITEDSNFHTHCYENLKGHHHHQCLHCQCPLLLPSPTTVSVTITLCQTYQENNSPDPVILSHAYQFVENGHTCHELTRIFCMLQNV
jgi:hypothetical protein